MLTPEMLDQINFTYGILDKVERSTIMIILIVCVSWIIVELIRARVKKHE